MSGLLAAVAVVAAGLGVVLLVMGLRPHQPRSGELATQQRRSLRVQRWGRVLSLDAGNPHRGRVLLVLVAGVAGALAWLLSGWAIAVVVLPGAALLLPVLLSKGSEVDVIAKLEGLEEWTRNLAGVLSVGGVGLEQSITASRGSCPEAIRPQVALLVARLAARTPTEEALRHFADDIDDSTGDLIASALILAALRRGEGVVGVLEGLAETVSEEVRVRREIEADRAKPRTTARLMTMLSLSVLVVLSLNGTYLAPYKQGLAQVLLLVLLGSFVGCLFWLKQMSRTRSTPRFLSGLPSLTPRSSTGPVIGPATGRMSRTGPRTGLQSGRESGHGVARGGTGTGT